MNKTRGFTLVEIIVYIAILVIAATVVIASLVSLIDVNRRLVLTQALNQSAALSLERMTREIRNAVGVDRAASTLGSHPGVLRLNHADAGIGTVTFSVDGGTSRLAISEGGGDDGLLTRGEVVVDNLVFYEVAHGTSTAVTIEMTLTASKGDVSKTENFYGTAVLRGAY